MAESQNAYRNEAGSVVGTIPHESMDCYFIKHSKNEMSCWLLAFEISKLKFRAHNLFDGLYRS